MARGSGKRRRRVGVALRARVALLVPFVLALAGCAGAPPFDAQAVIHEWTEYMDNDYVLRPGDRLAITVYQNPELTQEVRVPTNGQVSLLRVDQPIQASGKSVGHFRKLVQQSYLEKFKSAEVSVLLVEAAVTSVYVAGEVHKAGPVGYDPGLTLLKAVSAAGGYAITAKPSEVVISRKDGLSKLRSYRVNLDAIIFGDSPDFPLLPGDVVWVQTSGVADVGNWIELHIRRLLPIGFPSAAAVP